MLTARKHPEPMPSDDQVFWDRLADMPTAEAEQECVLRREHNALQLAMLQGEHAAVLQQRGPCEESRALTVAMAELQAQNTALNERIKYLRKVQNAANWRMAVEAVLGLDAVEQCKAWMAQHDESWAAYASRTGRK